MTVDPKLVDWFETLPEEQRAQLVTEAAQASQAGDVIEVWYEDQLTGEKKKGYAIALDHDGRPVKVYSEAAWEGWKSWDDPTPSSD